MPAPRRWLRWCLALTHWSVGNRLKRPAGAAKALCVSTIHQEYTMLKVSFLTLAVISVLFGAGCASDEKARISLLSNCKPNGNNSDCKIPVTVAVDPLKPGECKVSVDPGLYEIAYPKGQSDKHIHWEISGLQSAGFMFTLNGIAIDGNANPVEFKNAKLSRDKRTYSWKNIHKHDVAKVYYYSVNLTNEDGTITCSQDPRINNE
jgi:hypothetical protein